MLPVASKTPHKQEGWKGEEEREEGRGEGRGGREEGGKEEQREGGREGRKAQTSRWRETSRVKKPQEKDELGMVHEQTGLCPSP